MSEWRYVSHYNMHRLLLAQISLPAQNENDNSKIIWMMFSGTDKNGD